VVGYVVVDDCDFEVVVLVVDGCGLDVVVG